MIGIVILRSKESSSSGYSNAEHLLILAVVRNKQGTFFKYERRSTGNGNEMKIVLTMTPMWEPTTPPSRCHTSQKEMSKRKKEQVATTVTEHHHVGSTLEPLALCTKNQ